MGHLKKKRLTRIGQLGNILFCLFEVQSWWIYVNTWLTHSATWEKGCHLLTCFNVCTEQPSAPAASVRGSQRVIGPYAFMASSGIFLACFCLSCGRLCHICCTLTLGIFCFHHQMYNAQEWIKISCISNKVACVPQISHIDLRPCPATEALNVESGLLCKHHYMLVPVKNCYVLVIMELFTYKKHINLCILQRGSDNKYGKKKLIYQLRK